MIARRHLGPGLAVLGAMAIALLLVLPRMKLPASFDGAQMYLPLARRVLAEGFGFLRAPESVMFAPLAYLYPALLGASEMAVRWANVLLYLATVALAYDAVRHAHSRAAGIAAAFLIALAPSIHLYVADVLTEPLFMFATGLWAAAVARIASQPEGRHLGWIALGSIALMIAPLTRPAATLFAPAMALVFAWRAYRAPGAARPAELRLLALHALAVVGPALWILRNQLAFGVPSVSTGLGGALWLGLDPLVDGFDPLYFGMDFDVGAVARDMSHLSIEGDRLLKGAALLQLHDTPAAVLLQMMIHKVFAFVAVTSAELSAPIGPQRAWRAAMLALAACAIVWRRRDTLVLCLAAFAFYMVAVHVPLLYHHRYTVSALDVPLALLAAIALGECFSSHRRAAVATLAVVLAVGAGLAHLARAAPGTPHVERVPGQVLYSRDLAQLPMLESENLSRREAGGYFLAPGAAFEIPVRYDQHPPGDYTVTIIGMAITPQAREPGCQWLRLRYREEAQPTFAPHRVVRVPLTSDGRMRPLVIGTTYPLRLAPPGVLRLEFECASPATLELGQVTIVAPRRGAVYRQRLLEKEKG